MNEHDDVICQVRDSFSGLRMDLPVEQVFAASRARRRRRRSGLTAAAAATAGAAAALTLTLGGAAPAAAPARSAPPPSPGPAPATLAAFSVTSGPGGSTTLTIYKGDRLDPGALRADLARHGIPALVTVGTFCRSTPGAPVSLSQVVQPSTLPDGTDVMVINGAAMPSGTRLSIGYFSGHVRLLLIEDGARLSCGTASGQPAVHITPSGAPIRG